MKRKQRDSEKPSEQSTRTRGPFKVILEHDHVVPSCAHGPCLLFERLKENGQQFFACAVHRSKKCNFHRTVVVNKVPRSSAAAFDVEEASHKELRKKFVRLAKSPEEASFCRSCSELFSSDEQHKHPEGAKHDVIQGLTKQQLLRPTKLLIAATNKEAEAQYWFDQTTLDVIRSLVTSGAFDGVLCVGAPVLFEELRATKTTRVFLLDYDARFLQFIKPTEMARYSMLVDHFFDDSGAEECGRFLTETSRLLIVADPPFGVMVSPLLKSLKQIAQRHKNLHDGASVECQKLVALPYFLEKQAKDYDPQMKVADFKVTYSNHPDYASSKPSPIRFFTTVPLQSFVLPISLGYRFCDACKRYVAKNNEHCEQCNECPSKDGKRYKHCDRCKRCVKPTYAHCVKCQRCHLDGRCGGVELSKSVASTVVPQTKPPKSVASTVVPQTKPPKTVKAGRRKTPSH